jgi:hypothetical protein
MALLPGRPKSTPLIFCHCQLCCLIGLLQIQNYLHQIGDTDLMVTTSKALATRSLTLKVFVEFVSHLLSQFFKKRIINMSNYADEIPHLTKRLGYPGSVKKSWLITGSYCTS